MATKHHNLGSRKRHSERIMTGLQSGAFTLKPITHRNFMSWVMSGSKREGIYCTVCYKVLSKKRGGGYTDHYKACLNTLTNGVPTNPLLISQESANASLNNDSLISGLMDSIMSNFHSVNEESVINYHEEKDVEPTYSIVMSTVNLGNNENPSKSEPDDDADEIEVLDHNPTSTTTIPIKYPSEAYFLQIYKALKLSFSRQMLKFWSEVEIIDFSPTMKPSKLFPVSESSDSFFKTLSILFTGSEEKFKYVKRAIQCHLFNSSETYGTCGQINFAKLTPDTPEFDEIFEFKPLRDAHFEFICKFLKCAFGIFANGKLRKFGEWTNEEIQIFFINRTQNNLYQPVLSLK